MTTSWTVCYGSFGGHSAFVRSSYYRYLEEYAANCLIIKHKWIHWHLPLPHGWLPIEPDLITVVDTHEDDDFDDEDDNFEHPSGAFVAPEEIVWAVPDNGMSPDPIAIVSLWKRNEDLLVQIGQRFWEDFCRRASTVTVALSLGSHPIAEFLKCGVAALPCPQCKTRTMWPGHEFGRPDVKWICPYCDATS